MKRSEKIKRHSAVKNFAIFFIKNIISLAGVPGLGWLFAAIGKVIKKIMPGAWAAALRGPDPFLNDEPQEIISTYSAETTAHSALPYVEIIDLSNLDHKTACLAINFRSNSEPFALKEWAGSSGVTTRAGDDDVHIGDAIVAQGRSELTRRRGGGTEDRKIVRIEKAETGNGTLTVDIRPAKYLQQVSSNLIIDFALETASGDEYTLRELLLDATPARLPDLGTPYLANTLGVATIVSYKDQGRDVPYLMVRSENTAVFNAGSAWHCTSSYAARWEEAMSASQGNLFEALRPYLLNKLQGECGLSDAGISQLRPVAFCREMIRGGKPQLFCTARTELPLDKLKALLRSALAARTGGREKQHDVEVPWIYSIPHIASVEEIAKRLRRRNITSEAAACLYYWLKSTRS
jgi:hypothetical protein